MIEHHLTSDQIALLVDGRLEGVVREDARLHLITCEACRRSHQTAKRLTELARSVPLETAGPAFTDRVMAALPSRMYNPISLRILGLAAPVLGVLIVLATMSIAWAWYGGSAASGETGSRWVSILADDYEAAGRTVGSFLKNGMDGMARFAPFLRDRYAGTISLFSLAAVVFLATFDRFVLRKLEGRS